MKKVLYSLLFFLPMLVLASCSNDDDLPQVNMSIEYSGATDIDGTFYVVQGDTLSIDAINVSPMKGYKNAQVGATAYYWNYQYLGTAIEEPFGIKVDTGTMDTGDYLLQINATVYQVDRSVGMAYFTFPVKIVPADEDVPGDVAKAGKVSPEVDMRTAVAPSR